MQSRTSLRSYEDLTGAEGRQVFYRAPRYKAREVFHRAVPDAVIKDRLLKLNDFSLSGISIVAPSQERPVAELGEQVPLTLRFGDIILHRSQGRIRRIEPAPFETLLGVELVDGVLDVPGVIAGYRRALMTRELKALRGDPLEAVAREYRLHCADTLHFLLKLRAITEDFSAPDNGLEARDAELLTLADETILPEWRRLWHRGNELVLPLMGQAEQLQAAKRYTELVLTPAFEEGPIWWQSYRKPRGYPGDFELMSQVYEWQLRGETPYQKYLHRIGLDVAECIATRMTMIKQAIAETVLDKAGGGPARILSLGCGPAQEVVNYLKLRNLPRAVAFTLIDQDGEALAQAYDDIFPELRRHGTNSVVNCLETSFAQLLRDDESMGPLPPQDLIYSVGLVDYLQLSRARRLAESLFKRLAPGGRLIIGNMRDVATGNQWPMEFICDWPVHYRSADDMRSMVEGLPVAETEITVDPTGRVLMATVRRP